MKDGKDFMDGESRYADIFHLPRHISRNHPRQPVSKRASQFSSFDALKGFDRYLEDAEKKNLQDYDD